MIYLAIYIAMLNNQRVNHRTMDEPSVAWQSLTGGVLMKNRNDHSISLMM